MLVTSLTPQQQDLVEQPFHGSLFLEGPAGCGKTTIAVHRLHRYLAGGGDGGGVLVLVPQRTLAVPYKAVLEQAGLPAGGMASVLTLSGLARRMVDLFWPQVAQAAGFTHPAEPASFLTLETAQYFMAHVLRRPLEEGLFDSVVIDRSRLYSQVLDNLNKAAVMGFGHEEIGERLKRAWVGEPGQLRIYEDVQTAANLFRRYCLEHNLLDFSLQVEVFLQHLWPLPVCQDTLTRTYRCLFADNLEEDTPAAHGLLQSWLPRFDCATLVYDWEAGYRRFLGASPDSGYALAKLCQARAQLTHSFVVSPGIASLGARLGAILDPEPEAPAVAEARELYNDTPALEYEYCRYYPQMLDAVAGRIRRLVQDEGVPPGEIVVLAPYLPDSLRFTLSYRLEGHGVPSRSHRPSRALRDEPAAQSLLVLGALAHPEWGLRPSKYDLAYTLVQTLRGLDLVRARLLVDTLYRTQEGFPVLLPFENLRPEMRERVTHRLGQRYETLRLWLREYTGGPAAEFDHFLSRLFGEVLSQQGFGFHDSLASGEVCANLIESVQKFRWAAGRALELDGKSLGQEYVEMVRSGVIASQYVRSWGTPEGDAVLLAPAYTFLLANRPVSWQFWLDAGSRGWTERLYQPLTHPYVLSCEWPVGRPWTDADEVAAARASLFSITQGLLRRCRSGVYLGLSELGENGYEQRGPLLQAVQRLLQQHLNGAQHASDRLEEARPWLPPGRAPRQAWSPDGGEAGSPYD